MSKIGAVVLDAQEGCDDLEDNPDYPTGESCTESCENQEAEELPF